MNFWHCIVIAMLSFLTFYFIQKTYSPDLSNIGAAGPPSWNSSWGTLVPLPHLGPQPTQ